MARKLKCECGTCPTCKHREWDRKKKKQVMAKEVAKSYPKAVPITIWECSDGAEFSSEMEALRYELELFRKG